MATRFLTGAAPRIATTGYERVAAVMRQRGSTSPAVAERTVRRVTAAVAVALAALALARAVQGLRDAWHEEQEQDGGHDG